MRKKISVILCICLLTGTASGCGSEEGNLAEDSSTAAVEERSEPNAVTVEESSESEVIDVAEPEGKQLDWKQAYLAKAEEIVVEKEIKEDMEYDLIYLDSDDIPELVAGQSGYWFSLYTWKDGEVYVLMDDVGYGIHGRGYRFEPYQGIIEENVYDIILEEKESDYYTIYHTTYHKVTEDMEIVEQYELIEGYREDVSTYYYQDTSMAEPQETTEEKYASCIKKNLPDIESRFDLGTLRYLLGNEDDASALSSDYGNMTGEAVRSLLVTETSYDGEGAVTSRSQIKYEYDSEGNQIRELYYDEDELLSYTENRYDGFGNCIESKCYDANGLINLHVKNEYDEDGRKIKSQVCSDDERFKTVSVFKYYIDDIRMETTYSYSGEMVNKTSCLYDYLRGINLMRRTFFKEDIFNGTEEYMYDDSGNLIKEESYDEEGNALWFYGYDYDKNGNMIEETTLSDSIKYEYDEQGNKVKEIFCLKDGSIVYYVEWTYEWL